jgi:hypothetical protein
MCVMSVSRLAAAPTHIKQGGKLDMSWRLVTCHSNFAVS